MQYGYLGLNRPLDTVWPTGQKVTVYPDGTVVNRESNEVFSAYGESQPVAQPSVIVSPPDNSKLIILALVAIVALGLAYSRRGG